VENNNCESRIPRSEKDKPCGNGCYNYLEYSTGGEEGEEEEEGEEREIIKNSCVSVCPSEYHYVSQKGICEKVNCENGSVVPNGEVCGYDCLYDRSDGKCHTTCQNSDQYEMYNKICRLKPCSERTSNGNGESPCGSGCVLNNKEGTDIECEYFCYENYENKSGICEIEEEGVVAKESIDFLLFVILIIGILIVVIIIFFILIIFIINKKKKKINENERIDLEGFSCDLNKEFNNNKEKEMKEVKKEDNKKNCLILKENENEKEEKEKEEEEKEKEEEEIEEKEEKEEIKERVEHKKKNRKK
jgi:cbb3-type cytochrome oxidase subunit 3